MSVLNNDAAGAFQLHEKLRADTHLLCIHQNIEIRLADNALWPWIILVPHTDETELHRLPPALATRLHALVLRISRFIETHGAVDRINVAAIGNLVPQLHVHVVGRWRGDPAWPGVVWGFPQHVPRSAQDIAAFRGAVAEYLQPQ